jgi:hypothetical protein
MATGGSIRDIGSRLELFVDDWLIETLHDASLKLHHPVPHEAVLHFRAPWEGADTHYVTMLQFGGEFRAYYYSHRQGRELVVAVATSSDGVAWQRPNLGIHEWDGSRENNIIWIGDLAETFAPFVDTNPGSDPAQRFKAVAAVNVPGANRVKERWPVLVPFVSADGYRWRQLRDEPILTDGAFDSQNLIYWDAYRGHYVAFYRDFIERDSTGMDRIRGIKWAVSKDWLNWPDGQWLDYGGAPLEHFYTNAAISYFRAPHLYLAFPMRFIPERTLLAEHPEVGVSDGIFMSSRDGLHWDRRFREAFLRPGRDREAWTDRTNGIAWGILPTAPDELSIYWIDHFRHPSVRLRRGTLRLDGFASLNAGYGGGEMITRPLQFAGRELALNFATSAAGSVRAELQNAAGQPYPGFALADSAEMYGDFIEKSMSWRGGSSVAALAGQPVRLRLVLRDADVFSLRFRP